MAKAKMSSRIDSGLQEWIDARKRHRLSHAHVQMARELGMNPKKLGKIDNHKQEPWKAPLPEFIEHLYEKRFGRTRPDKVLTIEEIDKRHKAKKVERRARKAERPAAAEPAKTQQDTILGLAWYRRDQWAHLREISTDVELLEGTFAEWLRNALEYLEKNKDSQIAIIAVPIDTEELLAWCREQKMPVDSASRAHYTAHCLRSKHEQEEE